MGLQRSYCKNTIASIVYRQVIKHSAIDIMYLINYNRIKRTECLQMLLQVLTIPPNKIFCNTVIEIRCSNIKGIFRSSKFLALRLSLRIRSIPEIWRRPSRAQLVWYNEFAGCVHYFKDLIRSITSAYSTPPAPCTCSRYHIRVYPASLSAFKTPDEQILWRAALKTIRSYIFQLHKAPLFISIETSETEVSD